MKEKALVNRQVPFLLFAKHGIKWYYNHIKQRKGGNMKKRIITNLLVLLLVITALIPKINVQAAVKISKTSTTLYTGEKVQLKVTGTNKKVTWTSSKNSIATVDSKGYVTAKKNGTATITAKVSSKKYICKVTVKSSTRTLKIPTESYDSDVILQAILEDVDIDNTTTSGKYTLVKCKSKSLDKQLIKMKDNIDITIEDLISSGSISKITYNKDYTKLYIYQTNNELSEDDSMNMLGLYLSFPYIQILNGVEFEKADVYITNYDKNGKVTFTGYLKDSLNS